MIPSSIFLSLAVLSWLFIASAAGFVSRPTTPKTNVLVATALPAAVSSDEEASTILSNPMFIEPLTQARQPTHKSPDELMAIAKKFLVTSNGLGGDPDMLADDFIFEGPVVGPLPKKDFVQAIGNVDFAKAFPHWKPQFYGFYVDPLDPLGNRVCYTAKGEGVNEGPLMPFAPTATHKTVVNPPQACSITIDHASGLITRYTIGYVTDRTVGNTGGLGGLYGILYAIGRPLPFPEAQPWKKSIPYKLFQAVGALLN